MRDGFTHLGKSGRRDSLTCVTYLCRDERKITQPVPHSSQQRIAEILKNPVSPELYSVATMRLIYGAFAGVLTLPLALLAQSPGPLPTKLTSVFPKPGFVLHDEKLKLEKPRTVLGPISSDGKGNAVGSFAVYGGSNMIQVTSLSFSGNGKLWHFPLSGKISRKLHSKNPNHRPCYSPSPGGKGRDEGELNTDFLGRDS